MENGQKTIYELFDGTKVFNIPRYQRAFAWEDEHLKDFVDDLEDQGVGKNYFLGTILLQIQPENGYFREIDIVDGQQRLTTIVIFMKVLLDRLKEMGQDITVPTQIFLQAHGVYKLRALEHDNNFFQSHILQNHPATDEVITTPSQRRLLAAKKYFEKRLKAYSPEELNAFHEKLRRSRILTYAVNNTAEATLIFETTNDRGKRLTNLEKTKSFLMYKAYQCFEHPEPKLVNIQNEFSELYREYEEIQELMKEDTILQYHYIAFERWGVSKSDKDYYHYVSRVKDKINNLVSAEQLEDAGNYIEDYTRELRTSFAHMKALLSNKRGYLTNLFAVGRPAVFYPLLLKAWKYDCSEDKGAFRRIVRLAEIFTFKVYGINRKRSDTGRDYIYGMARDFQGDFDSLSAALVGLTSSYCNNSTFRNRLMAPDFHTETYASDKRYLFWQYENYLRKNFQPKASPMSYAAFANKDKSMRLSIEHIAAQNPKSKVVADEAVLPEMTEEFREKYLHCLGNLTFDPLSANASKSNNEVEVKMESHFRRAPFKTQNELDDFLNKGKWDAVAIEKRREKIVDFALRHWDQHAV